MKGNLFHHTVFYLDGFFISFLIFKIIFALASLFVFFVLVFLSVFFRETHVFRMYFRTGSWVHAFGGGARKVNASVGSAAAVVFSEVERGFVPAVRTAMVKLVAFTLDRREVRFD